MRGPKFDPETLPVRAVIAEVALGQVVLRDILFAPVCVSLLRYLLRLRVVLTRRWGGRSLGILKKKLGSSGE